MSAIPQPSPIKIESVFSKADWLDAERARGYTRVMAAILLAMGMGFKDLTLPVSFAVCNDVGRSQSGSVAGAMNMFGQLGAVFLGVLFGYIVKATGDFNLPLFMISGLLLLSCLLCSALTLPRPCWPKKWKWRSCNQ